MEKEIKQVWHFEQHPQEVWKYLTKAELIEQWLGKNNFEPTIGHKFCFFSSSCGNTFCEVLELEPFTKLVYTWQKNSAVDGKPLYSKVEWKLMPTTHGTEVQLRHGSFSTAEDFASHENGWNTCHNQINELLSNNHINTI